MLQRIKDMILCQLFDRPPCQKGWREAVNAVYEVNVYDCSNKAAHYVRALWAANYDADVILTQRLDSRAFHAVVRVQLPGRVVYYDPTAGTRSRRQDAFGGYIGVIGRDVIEMHPEFK